MDAGKSIKIELNQSGQKVHQATQWVGKMLPKHVSVKTIDSFKVYVAI